VPSTFRRQHTYRSIVHPPHLPSVSWALSLASSSHLISPHVSFSNTTPPHAHQDHPPIQAHRSRPPSSTRDTASQLPPERTTTHTGSKPSRSFITPTPHRNPSTQEPFLTPRQNAPIRICIHHHHRLDKVLGFALPQSVPKFDSGSHTHSSSVLCAFYKILVNFRIWSRDFEVLETQVWISAMSWNWICIEGFLGRDVKGCCMVRCLWHV
jgi:hypothetical protein